MPVHSRVRSLITVLPDGGRQENFVIHWPDDRISTPCTQHDPAAAMPAGTAVGVAVLENTSGQRVSAELFRLRDADDNVIGVASRLTGDGGALADPGRSASNWLLVIPSRGALFLAQADSINATASQQPSEAGVVAVAPAQTAAFWAGRTQIVVSAMAPVATGPATTGRVIRGTDEFDGLGGRFTEVWTLAKVHGDGSTSGQIRLSTMVEAVH
ncbi:MAG: hypothetical protein R3F24_09685 [Gammaproteobacteria bacterium]